MISTPVTNEVLLAAARGENLNQFRGVAMELAGCGWNAHELWAKVAPFARDPYLAWADATKTAEGCEILCKQEHDLLHVLCSCCPGKPRGSCGWESTGDESVAVKAAMEAVTAARRILEARLFRMMSEVGVTASVAPRGECTCTTTLYVSGNPVAWLG